VRTAADQGDSGSHFILGVMYATGQGVPQDDVEAHKWSNLVASRATSDDQKLFAKIRDVLAKQMTAAQLAEAQRRASEWLAAFEQRGGQ
jgi:TPR repeat protein